MLLITVVTVFIVVIQPVCNGDGSMLTTCATDRYSKMILSFIGILLKSIVQERRKSFQEFLCFP